MLFLTSAKDSTNDTELYGEAIGSDQDFSSTIPVKPEIVMSTTSCTMGDSTRELPSTSGQVCVDNEMPIKEEPNIPTTTYQPQLLQLLSSLPDPQPENLQFTSPQKQHIYARNIKKERRKLKRIRRKMKRDKEKDDDYYFARSLVSSMRKVTGKNKIKMRIALMDTINSFQSQWANIDETICDNSNSTNCAKVST
ncbi:unnamed protein product [Nesidiocoris tenuis]|uniref:BESS domain-containing protein n=1 Tax=Nesidiocoris tenuis TaxID=355587 RepID=A0A6H5HL38_9HEMI|nr:unnamed protein product [Nesidiocoris tenuis]